jgi:hypothetical protein
MNSAETQSLVEKYVRFFTKPQPHVEELGPLLDSAISVRSPLGNFNSAETFLSDVTKNKLAIASIQVHQIIADGTKACALYDVISKDPEIGTLSFSEWFETRNGRISSIISIYDASAVKETYSRI